MSPLVSLALSDSQLAPSPSGLSFSVRVFALAAIEVGILLVEIRALARPVFEVELSHTRTHSTYVFYRFTTRVIVYEFSFTASPVALSLALALALRRRIRLTEKLAPLLLITTLTIRSKV